MHIECLAQDSRNGNGNDNDEIDEDSPGQISLVHLLTGRTGWPVRLQEGGEPRKKRRVWAGEGKEEHLKIRE